MIELLNVNKTYTSKSKIQVKALDQINLQFNSKGLVFILGKSGSGKTSLLNIIGGLDSANSSKILINGQELKRFDENTCAQYRNSYIGFVFQEYNLMNNLNVYDNIALALRLQKREVTDEIIHKVLEDVELTGLEKRQLDELSGGQKQRVAIARALVKDPVILLADEPTGNLDSETSIQIFELFKKLSLKKCVIVVSHDAEYAHQYADRIIELSDGHVIRDSNTIINDEKVEIPTKRKAKLPLSLVWNMSFGNIVKNKLRLLVTCVIVSFLVAVLSSVYTSLYVSDDVTEDLMRLSNQDHLIVIEPISDKSINISNPNISVDLKRKLTSDVLIDIKEIALKYDSVLYPKTLIKVGDDWIKVKQLDVNWSESSLLESTLIPKPNDELFETIQESYINFTSVQETSPLLENVMGHAPMNRYEVVISNYMAELLLTYKHTDLDTIEDLINQESWISFSDKLRLKIVGIAMNETPLLRSDTTILQSSFTNLYVHSSFLRTNPYPTTQISYGIKMSESTNIKELINELKTIGTFTILPRYTDTLNRYTRYELTIIMGLLVPLIGYFMLIFLGNYIASSILFRKKQIGILRALGCQVSEIQKIFLIEALFIGLFIMSLVLVMVPFMLDILNFAFMVHFFDTYISFFHYPIFFLGVGHFIEVFTLIILVFTVLIIVLTHHINLLDPVDVISGR
ncbi:MAG TPA: ATP-binding cassette domain-containing protein [Erysipelotrichaceae bacterium]|nr:ATP-binding cassette domain-containing protein [Erysipelotrichaceae bacterium]